MKYTIFISAAVGTIGIVIWWPLYFAGFSLALILLAIVLTGFRVPE